MYFYTGDFLLISSPDEAWTLEPTATTSWVVTHVYSAVPKAKTSQGKHIKFKKKYISILYVVK